MTKIHKVTLLVIDHDDIGPDSIRTVLENTSYPSNCIRPDVMGVETREVAWSDEHPLNDDRTMRAEFVRVFGGER